MDNTVARRHWRRKLKRDYARLLADIDAGRVPGYKVCAYPTCESPAIGEDCCYTHSVNDKVQGSAFLDNEGIIDWQAIAITRSGERVVSLTWVEFEIAGAYMLKDELTLEEIRERSGVMCRNFGPRIARMRELADAL